jgi:hypothetical protein
MEFIQVLTRPQRLRRTAVAIGFTASLLRAAPAADAYNCSRYQGINWWWYTFEKGTNSGRIPGHAYVAFRNPMAGGYTLHGGNYQHWKNENGYSLFLVSSAPWGYYLSYPANCR